MFLTAVPILVVAFFLTLLIKEVPLRTKARGIPAPEEPAGLDLSTDLGSTEPVEAGSDPRCSEQRGYRPSNRGHAGPNAIPATEVSALSP